MGIASNFPVISLLFLKQFPRKISLKNRNWPGITHSMIVHFGCKYFKMFSVSTNCYAIVLILITYEKYWGTFPINFRGMIIQVFRKFWCETLIATFDSENALALRSFLARGWLTSAPLAYQLGVWKLCLSVCVMYVKHISPPSILHRLQPDLDKHDLGRGR